MSAKKQVDEDRMLSVSDVAARLKVSERSVRHWIAKGALPARKYGGTIRIRASDLETFGRPYEPIFVS